MEVDEEFYLKLSSGYRMEKPKYCPWVVYKEVMCRCWMKEGSERPEFSQLSMKLGDLLEGSVRQHYVDLNDPYTEMNQVLFSNHDYLNMKSTEDCADMNTAPDQDQRSSTPIECDLIKSVSVSGMGGVNGMGGVYGMGGANDGPMIQLDSYPDLRRCGEDNKYWRPY